MWPTRPPDQPAPSKLVRLGKAFAIWALKVGTTLASSLMHLMCVTCAPEKGAGAIKEG